MSRFTFSYRRAHMFHAGCFSNGCILCNCDDDTQLGLRNLLDQENYASFARYLEDQHGKSGCIWRWNFLFGGEADPKDCLMASIHLGHMRGVKAFAARRTLDNTAMKPLLKQAIRHCQPEIFRYIFRSNDRGSKLAQSLATGSLSFYPGTPLAEIAEILSDEGVCSAQLMELEAAKKLDIFFEISEPGWDLPDYPSLLLYPTLLLAVLAAAMNKDRKSCSDAASSLREFGFRNVWDYLTLCSYVSPEEYNISPMNLSPTAMVFLHEEYGCFGHDFGQGACAMCGSSRGEPPGSPIFFHKEGSGNINALWETLGRNAEASAIATHEVRLRRHTDPSMAAARSRARLEMSIRFRTLCSELRPLANFQLVAPLADYRHVWRSGTRAIRRLMKDIPPTTPFEVLTILMTAYAMATAHFGRIEPYSNYTQFVKDLGRWRFFLNDDGKAVFDEVAATLWGFDPALHATDPAPPPAELLLSFQDFVRKLVPKTSTGSHSGPQRHNHDGIPNRDPHIILEERSPTEFFFTFDDRQEDHEGVGTPAPLDLIDPPDPDLSALDDDLAVLESLDMFQDPGTTEGLLNFESPSFGLPDPPNSGPHSWHVEDDAPLSSMVVLLMASVAISFVILALLEGFDSQKFINVLSVVSGLHTAFEKSYASLEAYFLPALSITRFFGAGHLKGGSPSVKTGSEMNHHSDDHQQSSTQTYTGSSPANTYEASAPTTSEIDNSSTTTPSLATSSSPQGVGRLTCPHCEKTFATLSARNKHTKTGCKKLKRDRFRCSLGGCGRSFSTEWNRVDHETKRCPHRHLDMMVLLQ
ncbi:hypothetical protein B0H66DRAFT_107418 [Apodospora peruviana]|uniref:Uncharacterized protein n=1 Tax=Apodospora peruviana TaxID=516989 RepID=A0AAE0IH38_9PEZI|nr:hypothetical protein B0H66DRAFT_107418 [Apodospora peruviana]